MTIHVSTCTSIIFYCTPLNKNASCTHTHTHARTHTHTHTHNDLHNILKRQKRQGTETEILCNGTFKIHIVLAFLTKHGKNLLIKTCYIRQVKYSAKNARNYCKWILEHVKILNKTRAMGFKNDLELI